MQACVLASVCLLRAQYVTGVVKDAKGPVEGAYIRFSPRGGATVSDQDGRYKLRVPENHDSLRLICQCIGYSTRNVAYNGGLKVDFFLTEESTDIQQVVVRSKANINAVDVRTRTGNVEKVNLQTVQSKPASDLGQALQGMIPGLQVTTKGSLGTPPEIRVRGTSSFRSGNAANQPLYVLDGQIISAETFLMLNPEDLGEIKILKDAVGTALYGIRAANGVVEISSQRFTGEELRVSYRGEAGVTFRGKRPVEMMDSEEKLELERLLKATSAPGYFYSEERIRKEYPGDPDIENKVANGRRILDSLRSIHTDWYRELVRPSYYHRHTLSLRGGKDRTAYNLSAGFMQQGGQLDGNSTLRGTMRLGVEQRFNESAVMALTVSGGYARVETPWGSNYNPIEMVYKLNPYESKDSPSLWSYGRGQRYSDLVGQFKKQGETKNIGAFSSFNWRIVGGLTLDATCGLDLSLDENLLVTLPTAYSEISNGVSPEQRGALQQSKSVNLNVTSGLRLGYTNTWGIHEFTAGGDVDFHTDMRDELGVRGYGLSGNIMSAAAIDNSLTGTRRPSTYATKYTHRDVGLGLLVGYTLLGQYDIFGSVKFDASSLLPKAQRWNQAWAVGIGWDIKGYPMVKNLTWLSTLKLRASMGFTANLNGVSAASTINTFTYDNVSYAHIRPMTLEALANLGLKAEQNEIYDIGLSLGFPRVTLSVSAYRRITKEALLDVPIPPSLGFSTQLQNIGSLRNEGIELNAQINAIDLDNWRLSLSGNMSYNRSKVLYLNGKPRIYSSLEAVVPDYEVGQPIDGLWGLECLGINPLHGYPVYKDHEGREQNVYHTFLREDYIWLGHATPPISGGFSISCGWKNVSLDCNFYYCAGAKRMISYAYVRDASNANQNAIKNQVQNTWWQLGDEGKIYPDPNMLSLGYDNVRNVPNTRTVRRTDFIRLSGISLRYRFDERFLNLMHNVISYGHFALHAANLFTITPFMGGDPETGNLVAPLAPVLTFNLSLNF